MPLRARAETHVHANKRMHNHAMHNVKQSSTLAVLLEQTNITHDSREFWSQLFTERTVLSSGLCTRTECDLKRTCMFCAEVIRQAQTLLVTNKIITSWKQDISLTSNKFSHQPYSPPLGQSHMRDQILQVLPNLPPEVDHTHTYSQSYLSSEV